jgi:signal transduction histidine kinase
MYHSPVTGRYFQNFFIPIRNNEAQVEQVLIIGHEITELMETNARLKELNSDLEKSNRDLEQFAYVASHDLQEPLRKIQTFAELSGHNLSDPDLLRKYLLKISLSAERMSTLIRDVLNYSRLTRFESDKVLIDLNTILENVKTDLELLIEEKQVMIHSNQLPVVEGSPLQIQQLFYNLISNAIKFSRTEPCIRVWASVAEPAVLPASLALKTGVQFVELLFEDNGIGFEQQYADKIFSIFQRLHTTQEYAGTGIGLALCKKIVDNHQGAIKVKSEPGVGSCFHIYLPLPAQAPKMEVTALTVAATVSPI